MNAILAMAILAVRNAVRSRVVWLLLAMLGAALVGLPLTIRGDGTVAGQVQILLGYTLGFAQAMLALATLWAGCAAVSGEIEGRQMELLLSKPVTRTQVWLGKWLGLTMMNFLLLAFCGVVTWLFLQWQIRPARVSPAEQQRLRDEVLVARRQIFPDVPATEAAARHIYALRQQAGRTDPRMSPEQALREIRQALLNTSFTIPAGESRRWLFTFPRPVAPAGALALAFRFDTSLLGAGDVRGEWRLDAPGTTQRLVVARTAEGGRFDALRFPAALLQGGRRLRVEFRNDETRPVTAFLSPRNGLRVLAPEGSFAMNYLRTLLVAFIELVLLAALGITAGCLFSMPVASFTALGLLVLLLSGDVLHTAAAPESAAAGGSVRATLNWKSVPALGYRIAYRLLAPRQGDRALTLLSRGYLVDWRLVSRRGAADLVLYALPCAVLGILAFSRREIGRAP